MEGELDGAIKRWNTGVAGAHLCILRTGEVVRTVRLEDVAWHAGTHNNPARDGFGRTPFWRSHNINTHSVGVEIEGFLTQGYTEAQAAACRRVSDWLTSKYDIPREHSFDAIAGHHAHGELSRDRTDPGPLFDWAWVL
jgi:N-acetyl-anhydromuramyl-L-alanine amidase AmpD